MSKISEEPEIKTDSKEIDDEKEIEKKLSDLMNMGWTLLEQNCPLETCHCPLLKSLDGNKYCVRCEMWQFPDKETTKQRYTDLVLKAHQELAIRETRLTKVNKRFNINMFGKEALLNSLKAKLAYLSSILNETPDMIKSKQILENIELCLKNIRTINESM